MSQDVVRCSHCHLNQFRTESGDCRKCHLPLAAVIPVEKPVIYMQQCRTLVSFESKIELTRRFGISLRLIRHFRKLSQADLSQRINLPKSWISKIENDSREHRGPLITTVIRVCEGLQIHPHDFFLLVDALDG